jgi:UDP-N-acetylmuramoyl-tripeptide--D-alanyl-D-alanine ligase
MKVRASMKGLTYQEIAERLGGQGSLRRIEGYRIDSRQVEPGDLFFALKGEKTDGHLHLEEVARRGGVGAVVRREFEGAAFGLGLIRVDDPGEAMRSLAKELLKIRRPRVIGVTGSMGKTTMKEWIATLLEGAHRVGKSHASYNSKATFPLGLLNRTGEEEFLVLEMGMSEPGQIRRHVELSHPEVAVLTTIGPVHAEFFPDGMAGIAREKAEIFSENPRVALMDVDFLKWGIEVGGERVTFSAEDRGADYYLQDGRVDERGVRVMELSLLGHKKPYLHNLIGAIAAVRAVGLSLDVIERQVEKLEVPKGRGDEFVRYGVRFVNEAYNANPISVKAALLGMPKEGGKRIAVLGSMKELGVYEEVGHREVGEVAKEAVDHLLCIGDEVGPMVEAFADSMKPVEQFEELEKLVDRLAELMRPGDVVLVKGSRFHRLERVYELLEGRCSFG